MANHFIMFNRNTTQHSTTQYNTTQLLGLKVILQTLNLMF